MKRHHGRRCAAIALGFALAPLAGCSGLLESTSTWRISSTRRTHRTTGRSRATAVSWRRRRRPPRTPRPRTDGHRGRLRARHVPGARQRLRQRVHARRHSVSGRRRPDLRVLSANACTAWGASSACPSGACAGGQCVGTCSLQRREHSPPATACRRAGRAGGERPWRAPTRRACPEPARANALQVRPIQSRAATAAPTPRRATRAAPGRPAAPARIRERVPRTRRSPATRTERKRARPAAGGPPARVRPRRRALPAPPSARERPADVRRVRPVERRRGVLRGWDVPRRSCAR